MGSSVKCHPCRAKGLKRIEFYVTPERKAQLKDYCKANKITGARVMNKALAELLGPEAAELTDVSKK